jgi:adenine-specific DNA-methyltransferase
LAISKISLVLTLAKSTLHKTSNTHMPTLHWIGKEKIVNHHQEVPYKILEKQYTYKDGKETAEGESENKIIHGDNLEALKSLLPEFEGKVDCIYIDPPYNTGEEKWIYSDNVSHPKIKKWLGEVVGKDSEDLSRHDKWLCMMYPRLKMLHKLLSQKGTIFISIDDNEVQHLRVILNEIFGESCFIASFIWEKRTNRENRKLVSNRP